VLEMLRRKPDCEFDVLVKDDAEFTWNQLFYEVDRLSRLGQLCVFPVGDGHYFLRLPKKEETPHTESGIHTDARSQSVIPTGVDDVRP
jgi:hypothetical protein